MSNRAATARAVGRPLASPDEARRILSIDPGTGDRILARIAP